jgi:two-component system cell cycle sensor histidine kinase/response regulator CckA
VGGTAVQKILFVDDDTTIIECYSDLFRMLGYDISSETDPRKALERYRVGDRFSAVVIDRGLPFVSGTELAASIRQHDPSAHIVIVSGHSWETLPDKERTRITGLGISFIAKPFSSDELLRLLTFS